MVTKNSTTGRVKLSPPSFQVSLDPALSVFFLL